MATFEERIEAMTQVPVSSTTSAPTQAQVTQFLNDGIKDLTNKVINMRPDEAFKFAAESDVTSGSGITVTGKVLSVVREHDSSSILRPCSPMSAELRYEATDVDSLHYKSKYNPGWYMLNKKLYIVPTPESNNEGKVSQINYPTTAYSQSGITDFADEYEDLVVVYAAAQTCLAAAGNIQNNMPTRPTAPLKPDFEKLNVKTDLPILPLYTPPRLVMDFSKVHSFMQKEDFDGVDKSLAIIDKQLSQYEKAHEKEEKKYNRDLEIFKQETTIRKENIDREFSTMAGDYRSQIFKYQYDISEFQSELQEVVNRYKWYYEQFMVLMNEYNRGLGMTIGQVKRQGTGDTQKAPAPKEMKEEE